MNRLWINIGKKEESKDSKFELNNRSKNESKVFSIKEIGCDIAVYMNFLALFEDSGEFVEPIFSSKNSGINFNINGTYDVAKKLRNKKSAISYRQFQKRWFYFTCF